MATVQRWHRRHALQLASQLPDDPVDALAVLEVTRLLVLSFIADEEKERTEKKPASVLTIAR